MLAVIKGAGDLATGIAIRLYRSGINVILTDIEKPTTVRCTVAFSSAIYNGSALVEDIEALLANTPAQALEFVNYDYIAVIIDPKGKCIKAVKPDIVIDAIIAKNNISTTINDAPIVIGVGPGFTAREDCHVAIETQRGHTLGRVIHNGSPIPNTGVPGMIGGYTTERIIRATAEGVFTPQKNIGDTVLENEIVATIGTQPVHALISGVLRGILPPNTPVHKGMKSGDIDPRGDKSHCFSVSDKANAIAGGVLEAILNLSGALKEVK